MEGSGDFAQRDVLPPVQGYEQELLEKVGSVSLHEGDTAETNTGGVSGDNVSTELSLALPESRVEDLGRQGNDEGSRNGRDSLRYNDRVCAAGRAAADAASRQGLPRARSLQSQRPQTNADEPSFFRLSDGSPAQWRTVMLATLRQLSRTFSNPSSVITVENLDREDSIKNWRQNSSVEREEEEVGGEPTPKAPLKLSRSRSLKMALPAKGLDSRSGLGRATACGLEGGAIPGGLEETSAIGGGRFAREMAGGLERALGGGSVSGEEGREGASKGAAQGMVHVEHAQGAVAQIAPPNVRNLCSEEKAWRQLEADQTQNLGPRMTEVYQPSFGPVLNPAPEASEARQAQSAVWSAAQGQGLRFMERHDFGMPSRLDHLPRKGAISGKRAVEAAQGYLVGRRPQESLEGRFPQEYSEGKRPQEFLEGERPQDSLDRRRLQEYLIEGKRPQVYSEGKRPQAEPMRERTASGVEQSHDADSNLERTADVWESVREPVMESVRESVRESVHAKAGMRLHLAPPRLQHAQSVDSFFAHSETEPYARGAAGPSEEVHNPRGLYSGGPARAHYRLGRASLGVEDQSLVFAESYRSEEPIHTYQPALGRGSRPQAKRRSQPETGRRAPPARFDLPRPGSLPREAARSLPLSTGDMYQRDQFPGGLEVALHVQEGAAGLDRNISGHGALGNRFSVPPPLSLEEEMRSVRGGKRLLETPREGGEQPSKRRAVINRLHAEGTRANEERALRVPAPVYSCRFCGQTFTRPTALGGHMNCHTEEREEEKERVFLESLLNWPAGQMFVGWGPFSARAIDKSFQRR